MNSLSKKFKYVAVDTEKMFCVPLADHSVVMSEVPWIAVDLDGTLATHPHAHNNFAIGKPIEKMVNRVIKWLAEGKEVKIMTARAHPANHKFKQNLIDIRKFCMDNFGRVLDITCCKDYNMVELWDDRCVAVEMDTGELVQNQNEKHKHHEKAVHSL